MARGNKWDGNPRADLPDDDTPVDVTAVRRDDAFIEALAGDGNVATETPEQYELAVLLADWRSGIVSAPMPAGPDLDQVVAAIEKTNKTSTARNRMRLLRPVAGAAAAIAVVMGGATIFSYNAEPGDPLWNVKEVVFSQQADSTMAKLDTTSQLEQAERLIASGDADDARAALGEADARADDVRDTGTRSELEQWRERLAAELEKLRPGPPATSAAPVPGSTPKPSTSDPAAPGTQGPGQDQPGAGTAPWQDFLPPELQLPSDLQIPPLLPPPPVQTTPGPSVDSSPADPTPADPSTDPSTDPVDPTIMMVPEPEPTTPSTKNPAPPTTTSQAPPASSGN